MLHRQGRHRRGHVTSQCQRRRRLLLQLLLLLLLLLLLQLAGCVALPVILRRH